MTKREWLVKMSAVPLDAVIVDEKGEPFKTVLYGEPDATGYMKRVMMSTRDLGHIDIIPPPHTNGVLTSQEKIATNGNFV